MDRLQTRKPDEDPAAHAAETALASVSRRLVQVFPWHVRLFLAANVALGIVNWAGSGRWWALWPLLASGVLLAVHYLFYKAAAVDERWADARVEELNLKSYDRSHIESLKTRHGGDPGRDPQT